MHVEELAGAHFRNLERFALHLSPGWVVLRAPNAQGKTNLLEALYVCATGRSFRHAAARELLQHDAGRAQLRGIFSRQGVRHTVEVAIAPHGRQLRIDARAVKQATRLLELVNVVAFFPDDLRIIKGSPEERRRFLDRAIANHRPDFVEASLAYAAALKQRNVLLRRPTLDRPLVEAYDAQLVQHGAVIQAARGALLTDLAPAIAARFAEVMRVGVEVAVQLHDGLGVGERTAYPAAFAEALQKSFGRDRARGMTTVGPHRADVVVTLDGQDARSFASQGQQRALILAMKLAELAYLGQRLGSLPILLLDDVSSELDRDRTAAFFEAVATLGCQVWVSTTGAAPLPLPVNAQLLELEAGRIFQGASAQQRTVVV